MNPTYVRVEKVDTFNPNPHGIHNGYWVEGELLTEQISTGDRIDVFRHSNNRGDIPGHFFTSLITSIAYHIDRIEVTTRNSKYVIRELPEYIIPDAIRNLPTDTRNSIIDTIRDGLCR